MRQISVVMDLQPPAHEPFGQAGRAQCHGRQILAGRVAGSAARNTHDGDPAHLGEDTSAHRSGTATYRATVSASGRAKLPPAETVVCVSPWMRMTPFSPSTARMAPSLP